MRTLSLPISQSHTCGRTRGGQVNFAGMGRARKRKPRHRLAYRRQQAHKLAGNRHKDRYTSPTGEAGCCEAAHRETAVEAIASQPTYRVSKALSLRSSLTTKRSRRPRRRRRRPLRKRRPTRRQHNRPIRIGACSQPRSQDTLRRHRDGQKAGGRNLSGKTAKSEPANFCNFTGTAGRNPALLRAGRFDRQVWSIGPAKGSNSPPAARLRCLLQPPPGQRNGCGPRQATGTAAFFNDDAGVGLDALLDAVESLAFVPPWNSVGAAQITPPALAIKSGMISTPRPCSAFSASGGAGDVGALRYQACLRRWTLSARTTSGRAAGIQISQSMSSIASAASFRPFG